MIRKADHLVLLEHKRRFLFNKSETILNILLFSINSKYINLVVRQKFYFILQSNFYRYSSFRSNLRCLQTGRSYAVDSKLNVSRFVLRTLTSNGLLSGVRRNSW